MQHAHLGPSSERAPEDDALEGEARGPARRGELEHIYRILVCQAVDAQRGEPRAGDREVTVFYGCCILRRRAGRLHLQCLEYLRLQMLAGSDMSLQTMSDSSWIM